MNKKSDPIISFYGAKPMPINKYHIFELVCRKCGETINRRMTQFDELPNCPKCDNEMIVENVTTIKDEVKQNG